MDMLALYFTQGIVKLIQVVLRVKSNQSLIYYHNFILGGHLNTMFILHPPTFKLS